MDKAKTEVNYANDEQYFFNALDGQDYFFDAVKEEAKSSEPMLYSLLLALTTSKDKDFGNNLVAMFDTDSSFWVCDNSVAGHIYNNVLMYHGSLVLSIYWTGTAHRNSDNEDMMGTVILWLTVNEGVEHIFTLEKILYLKGSLVNIMSTRCLSELIQIEVVSLIEEGLELHQCSKNMLCFGIERSA